MFPVDIVKFLRIASSFFYRTPPVAASVLSEILSLSEINYYLGDRADVVTIFLKYYIREVLEKILWEDLC